MPLNQDFVGRSYTSDVPFQVGREHIRQFARAIGDGNPLFHDVEAAKAAGHADLVAPPTFLVTTIPGDLGLPTDDPALGLDYSLVVHGDQRFTLHRPVVAGDELVVRSTLASIRSVGRNEVLVTSYEFTTTSGELVAEGTCSLVSRGTAPPR
ncbi:MaoC family dehydratase N-terminal domain-containing protein [Frankia sp. Mgl5]|uniref:MaoC family dehydratase N-terminal domain-containing protein n=1 Tax=Frankia sp. Mgl5 TaxID=2933793 RepID=UPI00200D33F6|nr:MaoC family dehydratase N-terminal domain-containing protein [Frankia sp. Mgl5]MCK9925732.1 MaoC family dehydratase N-terminal domain-containing protein [Frankia sp. Mgl5]